ncbi:MAG: acetate--CoA ligase family protein [Thermoplasmata archaeon]|nr:MAG: acetate--CoA ligase family protein [Thermoplasmata archaeon]
MANMEKFFHPKSIAVVGASNNSENIGNAVMGNLLYGEPGGKRKQGFQGEIYPISLKYDNVLGVKAYKSVLDVPAPIDFAILIIPGNAIPKVLSDCGDKNCKNVIIISAGFAEYGEEGKKRESEIIQIARDQGIRFIGPNCLGIFSTFESLNASFAQAMPQKGPVAMISQSGALVTSIIAYAKEEHIGFSYFVSTGNKADIEDSDLIEYFDETKLAKVTAIYMESIHDCRKFYENARKTVKNTPIVILKVGKTEAGRKAASSHTGALAGSDWAYEAAFRQAGIIRVQTMFELFDATHALAYQPLPKGDNIAILTNAGGPGVIASDTANEIGLPLVQLSDKTISQLDKICPPSWSRGNPVDIIGDADVERYMKSLDVLVKAPEVDGIILIMAPTRVADPLELAKSVAKLAENSIKPIIASFVGIVSDRSENHLESAGVPTIEFPERAVKALNALIQRKHYLDRESRRQKISIEQPIFKDTGSHRKCQEIFNKVKKEGRQLLTLNEARSIFELFDIPMSRSELVTTEDEAAAYGSKLGFPLAMKISSKDIVHKTEAGGVKLEIADPEEAKRAFKQIFENVKKYNPDAKIEGVVMDQMLRGSEIIIGVSSDLQFGPMVMFGLGGTLVEVYRDVTFRLIPLTKIDALEMIEEIKGKAAYQGARGMPRADPDELAKLIVKVAEAVRLHPAIQELDINPLIVTKEGIIAVDARILIQ